MSSAAASRARVLAVALALAAGIGRMAAAVEPARVPITIAQAGREISRDQAVAMVQQRFNARVLRVNVADDGGRRVYIIQILSDGAKVSFVRVDATTGTITRD